MNDANTKTSMADGTFVGDWLSAGVNILELSGVMFAILREGAENVAYADTGYGIVKRT